MDGQKKLMKTRNKGEKQQKERGEQISGEEIGLTKRIRKYIGKKENNREQDLLERHAPWRIKRRELLMEIRKIVKW